MKFWLVGIFALVAVATSLPFGRQTNRKDDSHENEEPLLDVIVDTFFDLDAADMVQFINGIDLHCLLIAAWDSEGIEFYLGLVRNYFPEGTTDEEIFAYLATTDLYEAMGTDDDSLILEYIFGNADVNPDMFHDVLEKIDTDKVIASLASLLKVTPEEVMTLLIKGSSSEESGSMEELIEDEDDEPAPLETEALLKFLTRKLSAQQIKQSDGQNNGKPPPPPQGEGFSSEESGSMEESIEDDDDEPDQTTAPPPPPPSQAPLETEALLKFLMRKLSAQQIKQSDGQNNVKPPPPPQGEGFSSEESVSMEESIEDDDDEPDQTTAPPPPPPSQDQSTGPPRPPKDEAAVYRALMKGLLKKLTALQMEKYRG